MFRDGSVCFLVLALYSCAVTGQYTFTGPTSAAEGSTVTFTCITSPVQTGVTWIESSGSDKEAYVYFYNSAEGRCQRSTGSPPSDYTFDCNSTGVFSLSFPADYSRHHGSVFQCRNPAGGGESNNITLSVTAGQYTLIGPTSAGDGSNVTFTCTTSPIQTGVSWSKTSGPNTNIYVYYYNSVEGRCQRSSGAPPSDYTFSCNSTGVFSLSFPADYSRHSGSVFKCSRTAGPGESNNITLSVTGLYTLTGPTTTVIGSTVTFTCTTSPVENAVTWSETSGSNKNNYVYFYNSAQRWCQRSAGAPPSDYTFDCNSTGVFSLSFSADYSRHRGSVFQCRNSGGPEKSNNITLSVTGPPDTPTELLAWSDDPNSVKLSWKKGIIGGAKQHFRVQYKKGADRWTDTQDLYEENGEPFIQGHIQDLKPETLYFVRVQSFNTFGNSSFTDVERIFTKDVVCSCDSKEVTSGSNQILLGAGIVLFILSVVISSTLAIIFFRQKRTQKCGHNVRMTEDQYANLEGKTGNTYEELQQSRNSEQSAAYNNTEANF